MLAKEGTTRVLKSEDHIFEPKMDGYRAICNYEKGKKPGFISRAGNALDFPLDFQIGSRCVLDGEIVAYGKGGDPDFNLIRDKKSKKNSSLTFVAFDILKKDGKDLTGLPLIERKKILAETVKDQNQLQTIFYSEDGEFLWNAAKKRGIEGVMAKRKDSRYVQGRSPSWIKIKFYKTTDCVILGYRSGKRKISSLRLGIYDHGKLREIGNVGAGFTEAMLDELLARLDNKEVLVCEVRYLEFYKSLRAPVFLRLRDDKTPQECTFDQLIATDRDDQDAS